MKKRIRSFAVIALVAVNFLSAIPFSRVTASANSAAPYWEGTKASGEIFIGDYENCPLQVTGEKLTFDLQRFPEQYYAKNEDLLSYTGKVTAEYTFFNPTDYAVTAKMLFPFGEYPSYVAVDDFNDATQYDITINGEIVEKALRHTWQDSQEFVTEEDLFDIQGEYIKDDFFAPELPAYEYTFEFSVLNKDDLENYTSRNCSVLLKFDKSKTRVYFENGVFSLYEHSDGLKCYTPNVHNGFQMRFWIIGEDISALPECSITGYTNDGALKDVEKTATVALTEKRETTFEEFLLENLERRQGVASVDWYNEMLGRILESRNLPDGYFTYHVFDAQDKIMRWYEYEMTVPAGGMVVNAVSAPIYPRINNLDGYAKLLAYDYTYLLSPAQTWSSFENLEIVIHTPHTLTKSSIENFQKTESGYTLFLEELPEGELSFTLRDPQNIKQDEVVYKEREARKRKQFFISVVLPYSIIALLCLAAASVIGFVIWKKLRGRNKK